MIVNNDSSHNQFSNNRPLLSLEETYQKTKRKQTFDELNTNAQQSNNQGMYQQTSNLKHLPTKEDAQKDFFNFAAKERRANKSRT